ncbi:MAG: glycoside hydrolase family 88 protein, partial [Anaerolineae bacterium]|nr:glycoside hydrolase family 88 protein [Anaerolineae bacterium]
MKINEHLRPADLMPRIERLWELSAGKILAIEETWDAARGSPVYTIEGRYASRGWTEWTQGFQYGSAILQFDATGDERFLAIGRDMTVRVMAKHLTHMGVHDHGFNNVSTYGNLWRLMQEGRLPEDAWERRFYELALRTSGAVQARRWTPTADGGGFIYSFNGPHSLFADTIRSLRALALAHLLGHVLLEEQDRPVSLLERLVRHAQTTARYNVYFGTGRDAYDLRGRVAHESLFNTNDGSYRCPSTQQGYSPFSTWTRGLAWIMCGYAEELEFLDRVPDEALDPLGGRAAIEGTMLEAACATCDYYIAQTPADGIPYWDTGAPGLAHLGDYLSRPADPFNPYEPVDSSAAAIAAQGLLRLGNYLQAKGRAEEGRRYWQAGLTVLGALLSEPYLSTSPGHQGLILHSVYHRPRGWDYVPPGAAVPRGESSMWGDYHAREVALYVQRVAQGAP